MSGPPVSQTLSYSLILKGHTQVKKKYYICSLIYEVMYMDCTWARVSDGSQKVWQHAMSGQEISGHVSLMLP